MQFDNPDRALAFFALFFRLQILVQQTTNYPTGVVYMLSNSEVRDSILQANGLYSIYKGVSELVAIVYWLLTACVIFAIVSLIRGTVRDIRAKGHNVTDVEIGKLTKNVRKTTKQIMLLIEQIRLDRDSRQLKDGDKQ